MLLNFVIAILADVYSKLSTQSLGIYYDGIIARIPIFEDDARYGGLIVGTIPFNCITFPLIPFYIMTTNERTLIKFNDAVTKILFLPLALVSLVVFIAANLVLLPFAYIFAILRKLGMLCQNNEG